MKEIQTTEAPMQLIIAEHLSFNDVREIGKQGDSITRSPHIGNNTPADLLALRFRIPNNITYQFTRASDPIYLPSHKIIKSKHTELILPEQSQLSTIHLDTLEGISLKEHHFSRLRAIGVENPSTFLDYYAKNADIAVKVVEILGPDYIASGRPRNMVDWARRIELDGTMTNIQPESWDTIKGDVFLTTEQNSGWTPPLALTYMIDLVIEIRNKALNNLDVVSIYQMSGRQMASYMPNIFKHFNKMYAILQEQFTLPKKVNYNLIPAEAIAPYITTIENKNSMDAFAENLQKYMDWEVSIAGKNEELRHLDKVNFQLQMKEIGSARKTILLNLAEQLKAIPGVEVLEKAKDNTPKMDLVLQGLQITQYDIDEIDKVYVPESIANLTFKKLNKFNSDVAKLF